MLRTHLTNVFKGGPDGAYVGTGIPPAGSQVYVNWIGTRMSQLDAAIELGLWQEAFNTAEVIHDLYVRSKLPWKNKSIYFNKLSQVFLVSDNGLFHAFATFKYVTHGKVLLNLSPEKREKSSPGAAFSPLSVVSALVLSALSLDASLNDSSDQVVGAENTRRMAKLIGTIVCSKVLTRQTSPRSPRAASSWQRSSSVISSQTSLRSSGPSWTPCAALCRPTAWSLASEMPSQPYGLRTSSASTLTGL
jgi:hypothetical protein